jgi:hypothetical protein
VAILVDTNVLFLITNHNIMNNHINTMAGMISENLSNEEMVEVLATGGATIEIVKPLLLLKTLYVATNSTVRFQEFVRVLQVPAETPTYAMGA